MSLKKDYAASVRKELKRFAVWEPGSEIAPGDYGLLHDGTFDKLGSIREFSVDFEVTEGNPHAYEFASTGTVVIDGGANIAASAGTTIGKGRAALTVTFEREHALLIRAVGSRMLEISALRMVAERLREHPRWNFDWKIVAGVRRASPVTILMGASANSRLTIEGKADAIEQFKLGALKADAKLAISGEAALKILGGDGPILLDLVRLPRFFGTVSRGGEASGGEASKRLPTELYENVSSDEKVADDP